MSTLVLFAHGKDSGPQADKIRYLAELATQQNCQIVSPDYRDLTDPDKRVERLLSLPLKKHNHLILAGSSMGGYVSIVASAKLKPNGLFLMAPAVYMPGCACQDPFAHAGLISVSCGWQDSIIPVANGIRFAQSMLAELHVFNCGHRLMEVLPQLGIIFSDFLQRVRSQKTEQ